MYVQTEETPEAEALSAGLSHRCAVFLGNDYLGESWHDAYCEGLRIVPQTLHFFCSHCGQIWARFISAYDKSQHSTLTRTCPDCYKPGENFLWQLPIFFNACSRYERPPKLPVEAMRWDLLFLMKSGLWPSSDNS